MKNVTISLPEELAHRARVLAAEQNTSVSKYVGQLLAASLEAEQGYQVALKHWRSRKPMILNELGGKYPGRDSLHDR